MWRFGFPNPVNYNDNELFCGGYAGEERRGAAAPQRRSADATMTLRDSPPTEHDRAQTNDEASDDGTGASAMRGSGHGCGLGVGRDAGVAAPPRADRAGHNLVLLTRSSSTALSSGRALWTDGQTDSTQYSYADRKQSLATARRGCAKIV